MVSIQAKQSFIFILAILKLPNAEAQECLRPANVQGVIPFGDLERGDRADTPPNGRLVIVTSYRFQCCGSITRWQTYVSPSGGMHQDGVYSIFFQVWRLTTPGADDGCYFKVGEDRYENIILSNDDDLRGLVNRTVPQPSVLTVQPGDVVGFTVTAAGINDGSIQFSNDAEKGFDQEQAYYNSDILMFQANTCPFPVGAGRILDASIRAAPVLSLDIDQIPCPTIPSLTQDTLAATQNTQAATSNTPAATSGETSESTTVETTTTMTGLTGGATEIEVIGGVVVTLVLLILVIIILAVFLIKRRRTRTKNYSNQIMTDHVDRDIPVGANASYNIVAIGADQIHANSLIPVKANDSYNMVTSLTDTSVTLEHNVCYATTTLGSS